MYTAGRRQTDEVIKGDMGRLTKMGADFVKTQRGGETTYHGPGQLVIYPLLDLGRMNLSIRDYICVLQNCIKSRLREAHGIEVHSSEHTGVFLDERTKVASIGVQVSHRLTLHGLAMNVTEEPKRWFDQVVACGLVDVKAGSIADVSKQEKGVEVEEEARRLSESIVKKLERETEPLMQSEEEGLKAIKYFIDETETFAKRMKPWPTEPLPFNDLS